MHVYMCKYLHIQSVWCMYTYRCTGIRVVNSSANSNDNNTNHSLNGQMPNTMLYIIYTHAFFHAAKNAMQCVTCSTRYSNRHFTDKIIKTKMIYGEVREVTVMNFVVQRSNASLNPSLTLLVFTHISDLNN